MEVTSSVEEEVAAILDGVTGLAPDILERVRAEAASNPRRPRVYFEEWDEPRTEVRMLLKGGGSENVGAQYRLPDTPLKAGRDLEGVRRVVLDAVFQAQGKGCAPGVLGICIGGDRVSAFEMSKRQLLRPN